MTIKVNAPKLTFFIIGLLTSVLLIYKIYGRQSIGNEFKNKVFLQSPSQVPNSDKSGKKQSHIGNSSGSKSSPQPTGEAVNTSTKVRKLSKPVLHQFYMEWKKEGKVFYNEINPNGVAKLDVLLLHGQRFNSSTWVHLKTMDILVSSGFRVIAMDLPGYGKSDYKFKKTDKSMGKFLAKFIKRAGLNSPVIVSPSASGRYSLPYITGSSGTKVRGFVSIAAVATDRFPLKDYKHFRAPTLIMRGSKDVTLGKTSMEALQKAIPHSEIKIIGGARHACYLDKPKEFHEALLKFLDGIVKS